MGSIETTKDMDLSLTTNIVKGEITYDDLDKWIVDYYSGEVTKFILWDFRDAKLDNITTEEFRRIAAVVKRESGEKERSKSAVVHSGDLAFGLGLEQFDRQGALGIGRGDGHLPRQSPGSDLERYSVALSSRAEADGRVHRASESGPGAVRARGR